MTFITFTLIVTIFTTFHALLHWLESLAQGLIELTVTGILVVFMILESFGQFTVRNDICCRFFLIFTLSY